MQARFVGDPNDNGSGPDHLTVYGVEFVKGEWRDVDNPRFATHSHFEVREAAATVRKGGGRRNAPL